MVESDNYKQNMMLEFDRRESDEVNFFSAYPKTQKDIIELDPRFLQTDKKRDTKQR